MASDPADNAVATAAHVGEPRAVSGPLPEVDYERIQATLSRAVRRVCPAGLGDRRDDLVQVALVRLVEICRKSEGARAFSSSYLHKVAYSALVDELRRLKRRRELPISDEPASLPHPAPGPGPEQRAFGREIGRAIRKCLALMRRDRRLAITLHLQGHNVPEAAQLLGWGLKRTENLVYRGLEGLRRCLASLGVRP